jgi:polysaccharide pyruvyl transferase WcaK-like protein
MPERLTSSSGFEPLEARPPAEIRGSTAGQKTICLLGASLATNNLGVNALALGTISSIQNSLPGANVFLFDYGILGTEFTVRTPQGPATVPLVNIRFSKKLWLHNNIARLLAEAMLSRAIPSVRLRNRLCSFQPQFNQLLSADLVCSIAGGDSFSDIYGMEQFLYFALPQVLALLLGKPLILLPQTYGPFKSGFARALARLILRHAALIYSRDQAGLATVASLAGRESRFSHDMAFALAPLPPDTNTCNFIAGLAAGRPLVGVNVSGLLYIGGYTRDNMFGCKAGYPDTIRAVIRMLIEECNAEVVLTPHVIGGHFQSDCLASEAVLKDLPESCRARIHTIGKNLDQHEVKFLIGKCDFFIGSRMHACIAALSQSVPSIGLAYSDKFSGVLGSIGVNSLVVDLRVRDLEETLTDIREGFARRNVTRKFLLDKMPIVRSRVLDFFRQPEIESLLKRPKMVK